MQGHTLYLNKVELAERLGIKKRGIEELMRRRKIPFLTLGHRTVRFFWPAVEQALARFEHRAVGQSSKTEPVNAPNTKPKDGGDGHAAR